MDTVDGGTREHGFTINGEIYEVPSLDSLNNNEAVILWDYCKVAQEDFAFQAGETEADWDERTSRLMRHPGWWSALMHIAYLRRHPELEGKVRAVVAGQNRSESLRTVGGPVEDEGDEIPPTSPPKRKEFSGRSLSGNTRSEEPKSASSGNGSIESSDEPAKDPISTGGSRSDMRSISLPPILEESAQRT